jgi:hypothetical protein
MDLPTITTLLQRVVTNREQLDRLYRFLRSRYGSQFHTINSATANYLVRKCRDNSSIPYNSSE